MPSPPKPIKSKNPMICKISATFGTSTTQQNISQYFENDVLPYSNIQLSNQKQLDIKQIILKNGVHVNLLQLRQLTELRYFNEQIYKNIVNRVFYNCENCDRMCNMLKATIDLLNRYYQSTFENKSQPVLTQAKIQNIRQKLDRFNSNDFIKLFCYNLKALTKKIQFQFNQNIKCQQKKRQVLIEGYECLVKCQTEAQTNRLKNKLKNAENKVKIQVDAMYNKLREQQAMFHAAKEYMKKQLHDLQQINGNLQNKIRELQLQLVIQRAK